jgi:hypothetical protein
MSLGSPIRFLVVALFAMAAPIASAGELPLGVWKLDAKKSVSSAPSAELVIKEVNPDGTVIGQVFGKPIAGKWDGTKLVFGVRAQPGHEFDRLDTYSSFEGSLVQEKQGTRVRFRLVGFRQSWRCYEYLGRIEWSAHLDPVGRKK